LYFGIIMAVIVAIVIIGGIKRIASVTEKIVPFMAVIYVGAALIILALEFKLIPTALHLIYDGAFSTVGITGGFIGVLICTMTALVLVITNIKGGYFEYGTEISKGVELTATAFDYVIPHFSIVLTIAVILFAFSTMISWSYYGMQGWKFLFGKGKVTDLVYKFLFLFFVIIGASIKLGSVLNFSDSMIFAMVVPNMIGLVILSPKIKEELAKYLKAIKTKK